MATSRPFAYNTGTTIDGTIQVGNLAIGTTRANYLPIGDIKWWNGPEAMISSPLRAVKFLTPPMRPLLCLIICAIFVCLFYFINTLFFV